METIGIEEARKRLGDLVTAAQYGHPTTITRNGRPLARITPIEETSMHLASLVRESATGAMLTNGNESAAICLDVAARLYAAVAADVAAGGFGGLVDEPGRLPVTLETTGQDDATVAVGGVRYLLDLEPGAAEETVIALCEAPTCPNSALSRDRAARVCGDHLTAITPLARFLVNVPLAADDRGPDWEEQAGAELREKRLDTIEREIDRDETRTAGARYRVKGLRGA